MQLKLYFDAGDVRVCVPMYLHECICVCIPVYLIY